MHKIRSHKRRMTRTTVGKQQLERYADLSSPAIQLKSQIAIAVKNHIRFPVANLTRHKRKRRQLLGHISVAANQAAKQTRRSAGSRQTPHSLFARIRFTRAFQ